MHGANDGGITVFTKTFTKCLFVALTVIFIIRLFNTSVFRLPMKCCLWLAWKGWPTDCNWYVIKETTRWVHGHINSVRSYDRKTQTEWESMREVQKIIAYSSRKRPGSFFGKLFLEEVFFMESTLLTSQSHCVKMRQSIPLKACSKNCPEHYPVARC